MPSTKLTPTFELRATYGMDERLIAALSEQRLDLGVPIIGEAATSGQPVQIADLSAAARTPVTNIILEAGFRAILVMPLLRPATSWAR